MRFKWCDFQVTNKLQSHIVRRLHNVGPTHFYVQGQSVEMEGCFGAEVEEEVYGTEAGLEALGECADLIIGLFDDEGVEATQLPAIDHFAGGNGSAVMNLCGDSEAQTQQCVELTVQLAKCATGHVTGEEWLEVVGIEFEERCSPVGRFERFPNDMPPRAMLGDVDVCPRSSGERYGFLDRNGQLFEAVCVGHQTTMGFLASLVEAHGGVDNGGGECVDESIVGHGAEKLRRKQKGLLHRDHFRAEATGRVSR